MKYKCFIGYCMVLTTIVHICSANVPTEEGIQGRWMVVQHNGNPVEQKVEWIVSGNRVSFVVDGKLAPDMMHFEIGRRRWPRVLKATVKDGDSVSTQHHIAKLDGEMLTLKTYRRTGIDSLNNFDVEPNGEMIVLERVRVGDALSGADAKRTAPPERTMPRSDKPVVREDAGPLQAQRDQEPNPFSRIVWGRQEDLSALINPNLYSPCGSGIRPDGTVIVLWYQRRGDSQVPRGNVNNEHPVVLTWRDPDTKKWTSLQITDALGHRYMWILGDGRALIGMGKHFPGYARDFRNDLFIVASSLTSYSRVKQTRPIPHSGHNGTHAGPGIFNPAGIVMGHGEYILHGAGDHYCGNITDFYVARSSEGARSWRHYNLPSIEGLSHTQALKLDERRCLVIGGLTYTGPGSDDNFVSRLNLVALSESGHLKTSVLFPSNGIAGKIGTTLRTRDGKIVVFSYWRSVLVTDGMRVLSPDLSAWTFHSYPPQDGAPHPFWNEMMGQESIVHMGGDRFLFVGGHNHRTRTGYHAKITEMRLVGPNGLTGDGVGTVQE